MQRARGSIPGQGTRSHLLQLRVHMPQLRPGTAKLINQLIILKKALSDFWLVEVICILYSIYVIFLYKTD